ncbi:VIT domain-containing protein [Ferrimonas lipolytica]|uniref:VWA domain-containing protein n=1 Tax=Ferrimonas lipolytica TaxID=2724191 RepID=A0A6H1UGI3_9GAMM|nr:VIT domain-containing protein [Ferrimonas lipolytica]QIZ77710.1 VWA domain-containing protein [Ferrimonas lipolytica]
MNAEIGLSATTGEGLPLKGVKIDATLQGIVSEVSVTQIYKNNEPTNIEAVYTFPLPVDAALLELSVEINDKRFQGQVLAATKAEEVYEDAIVSGDSAILLKKIQPGLFSVNVGNLLAGESATIHFRYAQLHRWQGDRLRFYLPTTLAPRYGAPLDAGLADHEIPQHSISCRYPFSFQLSITGALADAQCHCPTHAITRSMNEEGCQLGLPEAANGMDRDLIIEVEKPANYQGEGFWAKDGEQMVTLSSFYPQLQAATTREPRCFKLLVDCSGSMSGDSIRQARMALSEIVKLLGADDYFNIIRFGLHHQALFPECMPADETNLLAAEQLLTELNASFGGTELGAALQACFELKAPVGMGNDILLITDGQVWDSESLIIKEAIKSEQRIFTVGVGTAVSEALLSELATSTGGASEFVTPNEEMGKRIVQHFKRIAQPALAHSQVHYPSKPKRYSPERLDGVFLNDTVHQFAWFDDTSVDSAKFDAQQVSNAEKLSQSVLLQEWSPGSDTLARLAAHSRLSALAKDEATALALQYQLVTEHTYCVCVKHNEQQQELPLPELRTVPHELPAGFSGLGTVELEHVVSAMDSPHDANCIPSDGVVYSSPASRGEPRECLDITPFLRCEAPVDRHIGYLAESLNRKYTSTNSLQLPQMDLDKLFILGEVTWVVDALASLRSGKVTEAQLVAAWLSVYNEVQSGIPLSRHVTRLVKRLCRELEVSEHLIEAIRNTMASAKASHKQGGNKLDELTI